MATITVEDNNLVVRLSLFEKLISLRPTALKYPLEQVTGITADPGVGSELKGLRLLGFRIPGLVAAGTFRQQGGFSFWNIRRGSRAVVITLSNSRFQKLVIEVEDPAGTIAEINAARALRS